MLPCRFRVRVQDSNGCRDVHVCVLRNRISFLSTVSPSIAFIFHGRSPLPTPTLRPFAFSSTFFLFFLFPLFSTEIVRRLASVNKTQRRSRKYLRREAEKSKRKTPPQRRGSYVSVFRYLSSGRRQGSDLEPGWIINRDLWVRSWSDPFVAVKPVRWVESDGENRG